MQELRNESRSRLMISVSAIVLVAVLALASLLLLTVGLQVYKNVVVAADRNYELRTSLSYIATKVRQSDAEGAVYVEEYDGNRALVLEEDYEDEILKNYIFYSDGWLKECIVAAEEQPDPEYAFETIEIKDFSFAKEGNRITLTAADAEGNEEELMIVLRSGR